MRHETAANWLETINDLISRRPTRQATLPIRRLRGEQLEGRFVLSTAPIAVEPTEGETLAEYLAHDHEMGPAAPAETPVATNQAAAADQEDQVTADVSAVSIDALFGSEQSAGAGEGEGE